MDRRTFLAGLPTALAVPAVASSAPHAPQNPDETPPAFPREFRGLWVATVGNVDWPSKPGLPAERQQAELIALFERARALNLNAIILQVRPACDALYASEKEPWSEYLTGKQGVSPGYDPLAFAIDEAHKRGLELHAWFNPYRARPSGAGACCADHICKKKPHLVRGYGKQLWLDPGDTEVQRHSLDVILDVVSRYDVDGVHLDDYFYPYKETVGRTRRELPFPDEPTYQRYRGAGGTLERDDWRRFSVDRFIESLYREVKARKPQVKVGISPFGIWRPGNPPQIKGLDPYASLYADSRKWLMEGWVDYFSPQLYWKIDQPGQSFAVLLLWWSLQNPLGRHLWPGLYSGKYAAVEIEYQTRVTRGVAGAGGNLHFSAKSLSRGALADRKTLAGHLGATVYAESALVPTSPWLGSAAPAAPVDARIEGTNLIWQSAGDSPFVWAIQWRVGEGWRSAVVPGTQGGFRVPGDADLAAIAAVDRLGNASPPTVVRRA